MVNIYENPSNPNQKIIEFDFDDKEQCFFLSLLSGENTETCCCSESNSIPLNFWTELCRLREEITEQVNLLGSSGKAYHELFWIGTKKLVQIQREGIKQLKEIEKIAFNKFFDCDCLFSCEICKGTKKVSFKQQMKKIDLSLKNFMIDLRRLSSLENESELPKLFSEIWKRNFFKRDEDYTFNIPDIVKEFCEALLQHIEKEVNWNLKTTNLEQEILNLNEQILTLNREKSL